LATHRTELKKVKMEGSEKKEEDSSFYADGGGDLKRNVQTSRAASKCTQRYHSTNDFFAFVRETDK
jgi:hypothetical protein